MTASQAYHGYIHDWDYTVPIDLHGDCLPSCRPLIDRIYAQLDTPGYTRGVSILLVPPSLEDWRAEHRTARKRADRAQRLGYTFAEVDYSSFSDDIHAINVSLPQRQGRPMSAGYLERHDHGSLPAYECDRHRIRTFGVLQGDRLVAYLTLYVVGELGLISTILGHGDHLRQDVMYLLVAGTIEAGQGGYLYYNRHDSGTDGLRYFKERLGFRATDIEWAW